MDNEFELKNKKKKRIVVDIDSDYSSEDDILLAETKKDEPKIKSEYEIMLSRLYQQLGPQDGGISKKLILPILEIKPEGIKHTIWINFERVCNILNRPMNHVISFFEAEFATTTSIGGANQLILKGRIHSQHIEQVLKRYIAKYVYCKTCQSYYNTILCKGSIGLEIRCHNCGANYAAEKISTGYRAVMKNDRKKTSKF